jgi:hypothetical protein
MRNEWAAFLHCEGVPQALAIEQASRDGNIAAWKALLKKATQQLNESGSTKVYKLRMGRTWTLSGNRITPTVILLDQSGLHDESSNFSFLALTIGLDCLANSVRCCLKPNCQKLFLASGKKKYCSSRCAQGVAKKSYRTRKRNR